MPINTIVQTFRMLCSTHKSHKMFVSRITKTIYEPMRDKGLERADDFSNHLQNFDPNLSEEEAVEVDFRLQQYLNWWSTPANDAIFDNWFMPILQRILQRMKIIEEYCRMTFHQHVQKVATLTHTPPETVMEDVRRSTRVVHG